jgi:FixJ family two-component response regulator
MRTVYLVDDDDGVRKALSRVLEAEGFEVVAFESAPQFLRQASVSAASCLVLDVAMPEFDGLQLQEQLAEVGARFPIVFVSGAADVPMCVRAMKNGATDFLTKPVQSISLIEAVNKAIRRSDVQRDSLAQVQELEERYRRLSEREREVLCAVVRGKLNKQIAADLNLVEQTVKFHRARLMEHMQARTVAELVLMAAKLGFEGDCSEPPSGNPAVARH